MKCTLCPRECAVDRSASVGRCGESDKIRISLAALHYFEEPCISGKCGTGAVFFVGCGLGCIYCQNHAISSSPKNARTVTEDELSDIFLSLQARNAHGIDLVTGTHFTPQIARALHTAKQKGLCIPVIWNSSGYEKPETLHILSKYVDVYLPDFKYARTKEASAYSSCPDYPEKALTAIEYMLRMQPNLVFDENGMIKKGVIVRHLLLPNRVLQSKMAISMLFERFGNRIAYSIMRQYTPLAPSLPPELSRTVTDAEYSSLVDFAAAKGIKVGYTQEKGCAEEKYVPRF